MVYLHSMKPHVIHGDIKPANMYVELAVHGCNTKLLDFGFFPRRSLGALSVFYKPPADAADQNLWFFDNKNIIVTNKKIVF